MADRVEIPTIALSQVRAICLPQWLGQLRGLLWAGQGGTRSGGPCALSRAPTRCDAVTD